MAAAFLALAAVSVGAVAWRRRWPYLFVGWFWYLGMLVPVVGLVQVGFQSMADRYTYLPEIGLCIGLVWLANSLCCHPASAHGNNRTFRKTTPVGNDRVSRHGALLCCASAVLVAMPMWSAWRQTTFWHNGETLWRRALACTAPNVPAYSNLAMVLWQRGKIDDAVGCYEQLLKMRPMLPDACNNLAWLRATCWKASIRDAGAAVELAERAVKLSAAQTRPSSIHWRPPTPRQEGFPRPWKPTTRHSMSPVGGTCRQWSNPFGPESSFTK